jgi:hypothetical protein
MLLLTMRCCVVENNPDEPSPSSLLAFGGNEGSDLRLIVASSRCQFRASDGVPLNVECFGPKYGVNLDVSSPGDNSMHKRSMHNSDEWPLVSFIHI